MARLSSLLEQPVVAGVNPPRRLVWHCSVHNHPSDPERSDERWAQIAAEFVDAVGLAPEVISMRSGGSWCVMPATTSTSSRRWFGRTGGPCGHASCQAVARRLEERFGLHQVGRAATVAEVAGA